MSSHGLSIRGRIQVWASKLKQDLLALWIAAGCVRTPVAAKITAFIVAGYAFSPIDLIPDFIPILGLVDDIILLPLGIILAIALIPAPLMLRFRNIALSRLRRPKSRIAAIVIVLIWAMGLIWGIIILSPYMGIR
jgi:uncharacterized membrane protein YkvA (DUF1232 family)